MGSEDEIRKSKTKQATENEPPVRVQVSELMQGSRVAILEHEGQDYRLRITINGKLILTK